MRSGVVPTAAVLLLQAALAPASARARVLDPTAINRFDLRLEGGVATPVGAVGGTLSVPFERVIVDGSVGFGLSGVQLSVMPKIVALRSGAHTLMGGVAGTLALSHLLSVGDHHSFWWTAELAYQRVIFIDSVVYIGAGVTGGRFYGECLTRGCPDGRNVILPELRVGFGRRY